MSTINTNGINVNYPVPGENNSTQGFRDNFASIKTNLDTAGTEITDLQNKAVLKAALDGSTLNNDMANTLISNASTRSFRATTYNLGNALSGTVVVNVALADVQYGTVSGNITLQFGSWAPVNTESSVTLRLGISTPNAVITFPSQVVASNNNFGGTILENYANIANVITVTAPHDVEQLEFKLRTLDCGNTISIEPMNRPYQSTQIVKRTPPPTGQQGDKVGTICVDQGVTQLTITNTYANDMIATSNTDSLYVGEAVVFTGTTFGNITAGNTYYVNSISSSTLFDVATTYDDPANNIADLSAASGTMYLNPVSYMYIAVANYSATANNVSIASTASPNIITVPSGNISAYNIAANQPIKFTGNVANLTAIGVDANTVYYVKNAWNGNNNMTISKTRYDGVAGPEYQGILTVASSVGVDFDAYNGRDIFRRTTLNPY